MATITTSTRNTGNSLRARIGGFAALGEGPPPLPLPGQQPSDPNQPAGSPDPPSRSRTPSQDGGDGGGGDGGDGGDDGDDDDGPIDDPARPPYISLDRWIEIQGLGIAIANAIRSNQPQPPAKRGKPRDPDRYDGTDPSKLDDFVFHCEVIFKYYEESYQTDAAKV
ncbi:hypothetical protein M408DRAFT_30130, partial [Serendipita vermifera MAFF 305830]